MRFWDSSALVPLLVSEPATAGATEQYRADPDVFVWWATTVECVSALARQERDGALGAAAMQVALGRLMQLSEGWQVIDAGDRVRTVAERVLRVHPLRAGDALQLAAAIVAAEDQPASLPFVTLDDRLADAASREGFPIIRPATA